MTEDEIAVRFEDTVWYTEAPIPDVNGMGRVAVGELAHSHGKKVILTGKRIIRALCRNTNSRQARDRTSILEATLIC
jgi:hypothetical protein